jgi:hypothetical protein
MKVITNNVVDWYQEDIFSRKMGALLSSYLNNNKDTLGELLVLMVMIKQRPPAWEKDVEQFIVRVNKNSFYLNRVYSLLHGEFRTSISTERNTQQLRRLAAMAVAKHQTGSKHPNTQLVEKVAKSIEENIAKKA